MPIISAPYASATVTSVSGTTLGVSGGATSAWVGRCVRMQNGPAQGQIRKVTAVASGTSITVDYAWTTSPYSQYGMTEQAPAVGNVLIVSHALDDIDDGTTLVKDAASQYYRLVTGQSLSMNGGSWLYDISKCFEFDSNFIRCDGAVGCFRFGDIDSAGMVSNGCLLIETSPGTAGINNFAVAVSGLTPASPDMHVYSGAIVARGTGTGGNGQTAFWRLYRDATQIVRIDGVAIDGNLGGRFMGSRSVAKDWRVVGNMSPLGAFNPKSPFGKIDNIQVVNSLQALYHFWTESLSAEAEGITGRGLTRLLRFAGAGETGLMLELRDVDIQAVSALPVLYQNENPSPAPGNTLRISNFLDVRIQNAAGAPIPSTARVVVQDAMSTMVLDTTTTNGVIARQSLRYRDMSVQAAGLVSWAAAAGTTYAPYAVAFASYGYMPATLPLSMQTSQSVTLVALADPNITLSAEDAAALYSKIMISGNGYTVIHADATLDELYDYAAFWITQSGWNLLSSGMGRTLVTAAGTRLSMDGNLSISSGVTLSPGARFKSLVLTGMIYGAGTLGVSLTDINGTRVRIRTADNIPLSTRAYINGVDQGFVAGSVARELKVNSSNTVRIYAHAYGYKPKVINVTGDDPTNYIISLERETNVDTSLPVATRDQIMTAFSFDTDSNGNLVLFVLTDLRLFTPEQVLNALHYYIVNYGGLVAWRSLDENSADWLSLARGSIVIKSSTFVLKVNENSSGVSDLGILLPLSITVDASVYAVNQGYTPVRKNGWGVVLHYAPWPQQEVAVPSWVAAESTVKEAAAKQLTTAKFLALK